MRELHSDKKPTIRDVASASGVSSATVSYVINGTRVLKPETRERVLKVMEEMNYHPSAVARGLSSKRVHTLGVHCVVLEADEFITNPYGAGILGGILKRASQEGFDVTLFTNRWQNMEKSAPSVRDGRTDGMIAIAPPISCDMLEGLSDLGMPLVAVSAPFRAGLPVVDVDNYAGAQMAVRHLIELGHTRIAMLMGNEDLASFTPRLQAVRDTFNEASIPVKPEWLVQSHFDGSLAFEQTLTLLKTKNRPTAIFAANDTIALEVVRAAQSLRINVPGQLSVIGFDNLPHATSITPHLTTINQPLRDIGACAAGLLIDRLKGLGTIDDEKTHLLSPTPVVRGSTAVAPSFR